MGAALWRGNGVTIRLDEPIACRCPIDRPFDRTRRTEAFLKLYLARKGGLRIGRGISQNLAQIIGQAAREMERGLLWGFAIVNCRFPTNFHA